MPVCRLTVGGRRIVLYSADAENRPLIVLNNYSGDGKSVVDAKEKGTEKIYLESSGAAKHLYYEIGFLDMPDYMKLKGE